MWINQSGQQNWGATSIFDKTATLVNRLFYILLFQMFQTKTQRIELIT